MELWRIQDSQIAEQASVATGAIYSFFSGKRAILTFVIRASFEKDHLTGKIGLPIYEEDMVELPELFHALYDKVFHEILCITGEDGKVNRPFETMLGNMFDFNADTLLTANNIENNEAVMPRPARSGRWNIPATMYRVFLAVLRCTLISWDLFSVLLPVVLGTGYLISIFRANALIGGIMHALAIAVVWLNVFFMKRFEALEKEQRDSASLL